MHPSWRLAAPLASVFSISDSHISFLHMMNAIVPSLLHVAVLCTECPFLFRSRFLYYALQTLLEIRALSLFYSKLKSPRAAWPATWQRKSPKRISLHLPSQSSFQTSSPGSVTRTGAGASATRPAAERPRVPWRSWPRPGATAVVAAMAAATSRCCRRS